MDKKYSENLCHAQRGIHMDNVIPFPSNLDNFAEVEELIFKVGKQAGLSEKKIAYVVKEYREYYKQLFVKYEASMELPADLGINQEQTKALLQLYRNSTQDLHQQYRKQISHACHIIIGLLIKEQLIRK